jgi:hypothetical protein
VKVIGLSGDGLFGSETMATLTRFRAQTAVTFPILLSDATRRRYGRGHQSISPYPFDVIVDKSGIIRHTSARFDIGETKRIIDSLLADGG